MDQKLRIETEYLAKRVLLGCSIALGLIIVIALIVVTIFFKPRTEITELNQPFEHGRMRITAVDIKAVPVSGEEIEVFVEFIVENISTSKELSLRYDTFNAYIDDVAAQSTHVSWSNPSWKKDLGYEIAPSKRTEGHWIVRIPKSGEILELHMVEAPVIFVFQVPPLS